MAQLAGAVADADELRRGSLYALVVAAGGDGGRGCSRRPAVLGRRAEQSVGSVIGDGIQVGESLRRSTTPLLTRLMSSSGCAPCHHGCCSRHGGTSATMASMRAAASCSEAVASRMLYVRAESLRFCARYCRSTII
jgi:hypothetical protein